jgi:hypothetical protein
VAIDENYKLMSIWDVIPDEEYRNVAEKLSAALINSEIQDIFKETFNELNALPYESCKPSNPTFLLGVISNHKQYTQPEAEAYKTIDGKYIVSPGERVTFSHLHLRLPNQFVDNSGKSIETISAGFRDAKNVFKRAMGEIPLDTLELVKDLINQNSLLDGQTHLYKVEKFIELKRQYLALPINELVIDNWYWIASYNNQFAKFRNELIGKLCTELAEGRELNEACQSWNKLVDPINYMKTTAPITNRQIAEAKQFVEDGGYTESFDRRFANMDDIKASEIKYMNVGDGKLKNVSMFDTVKSTSTRHKRSEFDGIEEVSIEKFMQDIRPTCTSVEAYLVNTHEGNLMSLTTANNKSSKQIFKWNNNFSWTFNGNLAGKSQIKQAVKGRGGNVEGILRASMHFPNTTDDYDLHLKEPRGYEIYYGNRRSISPCSGTLDLDAQGCDGHQTPENRVENIIYTDKNRMTPGEYKIYAHNYSGRAFHTPFDIEIEINGDITTATLDKPSSSNTVNIAIIKYDGKNFDIVFDEDMRIIESKTISREIYGLQTNEFHKVNLICVSPNHWDDNNIGNKHYFFMLDGCKSPSSIRSFHNENLLPELAQHRKVLEILGAVNMIQSTDKQLSGIGFNATVHDELIVRLQGSFKRVIKIKF